MLVPPEGYSMVEMGIFRCSKLDAINISFLKCINLKSIIWIGEENPCRAIQQFIRENSIKLHHLTSSGFTLAEEKANKSNQDWMVLRPSIIGKAIELILNSENHNCLVLDTSEVIIGVLRNIQKWNYYNILDEYRLYSRKSSYKAATFLEMIKIDLVPNDEDLKFMEPEVSLSAIEVFEKEDEEGDTTSELFSSVNHGVEIPTNSIDITRNLQQDVPTSVLSTSWQATSPTFRRLSCDHQNERLGISTSPQIPSTLLRRAKRPPKSGSKTPSSEPAPSTTVDEASDRSLNPTYTLNSTKTNGITDRHSIAAIAKPKSPSPASSVLPAPLVLTLPPQRTLPTWFQELQEYF